MNGTLKKDQHCPWSYCLRFLLIGVEAAAPTLFVIRRLDNSIRSNFAIHAHCVGSTAPATSLSVPIKDQVGISGHYSLFPGMRVSGKLLLRSSQGRDCVYGDTCGQLGCCLETITLPKKPTAVPFPVLSLNYSLLVDM